MASVEAYPYSKGPVTILFSPVENFVEYSLDYGVTWYARPVVYSNKLNNGTIYSFTSYMINSILLKKNGEIVFCTFNTADSTFKFTTFSKTGSKITEAPVKEVTSANSVFSGYSDRMFFLKDEEYMFPISNMSITYTLNGGTTWTTVAYSISNSAQSIPGVAAYSERDGAYYVQGGGNYGVSNAALRKSTDLVSWSNISPSFTTTSAGTHLMYGPTQLIFSGSKAICVNSDGSYITVTDFSATKPEPVAIGSGSVGVPPWIVQDLDGLFYVPGIYNATDNDNGVTYSSDGINWLRKYDTNSSTSIRMNGYRNGKITYIDSNWNEVSVPRIKSTNAIFELYKTSYTTV
jgi:hypothetical protein